MLSGSQPPRRPEEEAPASTDHAREIMEGLPKSAVLEEGSTKTSGGLERGGDAPTRGVTFRRTFDPNSPGPGGALGGFMSRQDSGALVRDGAGSGQLSSARSDESGASGTLEGGASTMGGRTSTGMSAASGGSVVDAPATIPEARTGAQRSTGDAGGAPESKTGGDAPQPAAGAAKPGLFGRLFRRGKSEEQSAPAASAEGATPGAAAAGGPTTATQ